VEQINLLLSNRQKKAGFQKVSTSKSTLILTIQVSDEYTLVNCSLDDVNVCAIFLFFSVRRIPFSWKKPNRIWAKALLKTFILGLGELL
jgi:hypothetical protein